MIFLGRAYIISRAVVSSVVRASVLYRKVVDFRFDSRTGNASLYPWESHFRHISHREKLFTRIGGLAQQKTCKPNPKIGWLAFAWLDCSHNG